MKHLNIILIIVVSIVSTTTAINLKGTIFNKNRVRKSNMKMKISKNKSINASSVEIDMGGVEWTEYYGAGWEVKGNIKYPDWITCEDEKDNYNYNCDFFVQEPTKSDISTSSGNFIACEGNDVGKTVYNKGSVYYACAVFESTDKTVVGFSYSKQGGDSPTTNIPTTSNPASDSPTTSNPTTGGPGKEIELDMSGVTYSEMSASGTMRYINWDDCSSVYSNYRYQCKFSSSIPTKDSMPTDNGKNINCYGNLISETATSSYYLYFGCVVYNDDSKEKIGFAYIEKGENPTTNNPTTGNPATSSPPTPTVKPTSAAPTTPKPTTPTVPPTPPPPQKPSLKMDGIKVKLSGSVWNAKGSVKYDWKACVNESSSYKLYCNFFNTSSITANIFNKTEPMNVKCDGNEIDQSYDNKEFKFLGCLLTNSTEFEIIGYTRGYVVTKTEYVVIGVICGGTLLYVIVSIMYMIRKCKKERKNKKKAKKTLLDNQH